MNIAARKAAAILVTLAVIASPFASVVTPLANAAPVVVADNFKISGVVFNDLNTNDHYNNGEPLLEGWTVKLHQGDENGPVVAHDTTDAGGNYFFGHLSADDYFVEEIVKDGWDETSSDTKVTLSSEHSDVTVNFANVQDDQDGGGNGDGGNGGDNGGTGGGTTPPPPTTVTIDASNVVCTDPTQLPDWGANGHPAITATSAKDWVAAHASCSFASGWSFEYAYQYTPFGGDTTIGHVDGFTAFGPTTSIGSSTITFTPASTTAIQVREQLEGGFIPFTYTSDSTNGTVPSAQMYCNTDVANYDNADFVTAPVAGNTYYCAAFNSPTPVVVTPPADNGGGSSDPAPAVTSGGNGGGGVVMGGPLSIGFVNTNTGGGLVLGTSTEDTSGTTCSVPLLSTFMRAGMHNDKNEVTKLQTFLNSQLGINMPVTGFFGSQTTAGVNAFQVKYQSDVLSPWASFGLDGHTPTGYVYKTTQHKINNLACSALNLPAPQLP
jgi:hypothetical protein